jgi:ribosome production factor 2
MSIAARKPKNARAKRAMAAREPKMVEGERSALWMRGTSTSEAITAILKDLHDLKKPDSTNFSRRNEKRPFEDETSVEFLCQKNECSIFGFGSHSKKRPNNMILGRLFDYKIYDMYELALTDIRTSTSFKACTPTLGNRPLLVFQGDAFENDPKLGELKSLFLDMFGHEAMHKVNLKGIEHAIVLTAQAAQGDKEGKIAFRHYYVAFKKSGGRVPRVELEEVGPHFDMEVLCPFSFMGCSLLYEAKNTCSRPAIKPSTFRV